MYNMAWEIYIFYLLKYVALDCFCSWGKHLADFENVDETN